jgi:hypothetical protein
VKHRSARLLWRSGRARVADGRRAAQRTTATLRNARREHLWPLRQSQTTLGPPVHLLSEIQHHPPLVAASTSQRCRRPASSTANRSNTMETAPIHARQATHVLPRIEQLLHHPQLRLSLSALCNSAAQRNLSPTGCSTCSNHSSDDAQKRKPHRKVIASMRLISALTYSTACPL